MSRPLRIRFHNSVRTRLFLLVLLAVLPAFAVQVYGAWSDLQQSIAERKQESLRISHSAQNAFADLLSESQLVFSDLVRQNNLRGVNNCTQVFTALRFAYERLAPDATNLGLADGAGNIYCAIQPVLGDKNISGQPDFINALRTVSLSPGIYQPNPSIGSPLVRLSYPVLSFDGYVQTVIFATFDMNWFKRWQTGILLPPDTSVTLFSTDGSPLWRAVNGQNVSLAGIHLHQTSWFTSAQNGQSVTEGPDFDGTTRLHTLIPLNQTSTLHLGFPVRELYEKAYADLLWKLALLSGVVIAAMLLAWWGSKTMFLQPLTDLLKVVKQVEGGDFNARVSAVRGLAELTDLAQSFDRMTAALQLREHEQRQLEKRFRAAFESSAIGMGLMTLDGRILAVNAAVCKMSGYTEEELMGRYDSQNVYPPDLQNGMDLFAEMIAGQRGYYSVEKRYLRKNGEPFWTRLTLSLVRDENGKPDYLIGLVENIDEQKHIKQNLLESEARFTALFEHAPVGISLIAPDEKYRVVAANPTLSVITGYSTEELMRMNHSELTYPDDAEIGLKEFHELLEGQRSDYQMERRLIHKSGRIFWARITVFSIRNPHGDLSFLVSITEDIDEEKRKSEALVLSEARFKAMYDNTTVGMAMMSLDMKVISINQTSARMTGYSQEELIGRNPSFLALPEDVEIGRAEYQELIAGKISGFEMVKRYRRKDGSIFWGRVTYSVVPGKLGKPEYLVGMIEDVTDQKNSAERLAEQEAEYRRLLEQRIAERTEELSLANERLREKATQDAIASERTRLARDLHDAVTQTLFSTTLIAEVLPEIWEMNPIEGKRRLEELRLLTRGALAEMRTLLVELRPNALVEVPLPTLLRQLTEAIAGRARLNIQFSTEGERKLPADVQVGLYRIAQEALNNIFKHARATQAVLTLRMGETVRLTVVDNGTGFDQGTVTSDHLGLKIMRERAESIGAKFSIYSEPNEGTQVSILWQAKQEQ